RPWTAACAGDRAECRVVAGSRRSAGSGAAAAAATTTGRRPDVNIERALRRPKCARAAGIDGHLRRACLERPSPRPRHQEHQKSPMPGAMMLIAAPAVHVEDVAGVLACRV